MPHNLNKKYNSLLELNSYNESQRNASLRLVFDRDFVNCSQISINNKPLYPYPHENKNGDIKMATLFSHLTRKISDQSTKAREYDPLRSERLHWTKHHISNYTKHDDVFLFSAHSAEGPRTYLWNSTENYVVIFEPLRDNSGYYLLTHYPLRGHGQNKMKNTYKRKLDVVL